MLLFSLSIWTWTFELQQKYHHWLPCKDLSILQLFRTLQILSLSNISKLLESQNILPDFFSAWYCSLMHFFLVVFYTVSKKFVHLAWSTLSAYHSRYTDSRSIKIGQINNLGPKFHLSLIRLKSVKHHQDKSFSFGLFYQCKNLVWKSSYF